MTGKTTVVQALCAVQAELKAVGKGGTAAQQVGGYSYRTIDDVLAAVHPLFAKHGVVIAPVAVTPTVTPGDRSGWRTLALHITYALYGPEGDHIEIQAYGEAISNTATAAGVAASYAFKTAVSQLLTLPTDDPHSDPETGAIPDPMQWWETAGWETRKEHDEARTAIGDKLRSLEDGPRETVKAALTDAGHLVKGRLPKPLEADTATEIANMIETTTEPF